MSDDTTSHPWSVYESEVNKMMRTQDAMNALATSPQPPLHQERSYVAHSMPQNQETALLARGDLPCYQHLVRKITTQIAVTVTQDSQVHEENLKDYWQKNSDSQNK